jgi:superoxide dismutase, Cu-Zn family
MNRLHRIGIVMVWSALGLSWNNLAVVGQEKAAFDPTVKKAVCMIHALDKSGVVGTATFVQREGYVEVTAEVSGLTPGLHGFHVHEFGDCSMKDGSSAGGHFNPTNMPHGGPDSPKHHEGDLGNLQADKAGMAKFLAKDKSLQLNGPYSIVGRSLIIHEKVDDLKTQPSGDSGKRIACGVIGIAKPD